MESIQLRRATPWDAQEMREVFIKSQWFTYENLYTTADIQKLIKEYYNINRIKKETEVESEEWHGYYIAEVGREIAGIIGGGLIEEEVGEVYVLYVNPSLRGKGIGTRLLNYFTKIQKHTYGAKTQWVAVAKGNQFGIPFYESKNFIFQHESAVFDINVDEEEKITLRYKRMI